MQAAVDCHEEHNHDGETDPDAPSSPENLLVEPKKKKNKKYCIAFGCLSANLKNPDLTFFTLPRDITRRHEWLTSINRMDLLHVEEFKYKARYVCSLHFAESAFRTIKHLATNAIPTLVPIQSIQVEFVPVDSSLTPVDTYSTLPIHRVKKETASVKIQTETSPTFDKGTQTISLLRTKTIRKRRFKNGHPITKHKNRRLESDIKTGLR